MSHLLTKIRDSINSLFAKHDAFSIIITILITQLILYISFKSITPILKYGFIPAMKLFWQRLLERLFKIPFIEKIIDKKMITLKDDLEKQLNGSFPASKYVTYYELPKNGIERELIRKELLHQMEQEKLKIHKRAHGGVYISIQDKYEKYLGNNNQEIINIIDKYFSMKDEAYLLFSHSNTLYPFIFPATRKFDVELISMCSKLLYAKEPSGNITCGGTESIFLAMKCWKTYGKEVKNIKNANIILPKTGHPAFVKSCKYLGIDVKYAPVITDINSKLYGTVNLKKMEKLIDRNTICLIGSAPNFPYSVVDDIEAICVMAKKHGNIPVHVDNCLGGFVLSFLYDCHKINKPFDFRVDGVCSISCDIHKHAGSDKGCSVILYSSYEYRRYQYITWVDWPGGLFTSATFAGSANGGLKAVAWSMLINKGKNNIQQSAIDIFDKTKYLKTQIMNEFNEYCDVLGEPIACAVAFKFKNKLQDLDYAIGEALYEVNHWELLRLQNPCALFFHSGHGWMELENIDQFVVDLHKAIKLVLENPEKYNQSGMAALYGTTAKLPPTLTEQALSIYLDVVHSPY